MISRSPVQDAVHCFAETISHGGSHGCYGKGRGPLSQDRSNFSELAKEVKAGAEKIITKNGESYVAMIDAHRLDYYRRLERECIHLILIEEASKGLADVATGHVQDARAAISRIKRRHAA